MMSSPTTEQQHVMNVNAHTVVVVPVEDTMRQAWRCVYIDMGFVKGINGILIVAEMIMAMFGLISTAVPKNKGCAYLYGDTYSYYESVASALLVFSAIWYLLYMLALPKKADCLPWKVACVILYGLFFLNYGLASAMIAFNACWQGGYKAAAGFGFACVAALIAHVVYHVRQCRESRPQPVPVYTSASSSAIDMSDLAKPPRY